MKHSYSVTCNCPRCSKERTRREAQARANRVHTAWPAARYRGRTAIAAQERRERNLMAALDNDRDDESDWS